MPEQISLHTFSAGRVLAPSTYVPPDAPPTNGPTLSAALPKTPINDALCITFYITQTADCFGLRNECDEEMWVEVLWVPEDGDPFEVKYEVSAQSKAEFELPASWGMILTEGPTRHESVFQENPLSKPTLSFTRWRIPAVISFNIRFYIDWSLVPSTPWEWDVVVCVLERDGDLDNVEVFPANPKHRFVQARVGAADEMFVDQHRPIWRPRESSRERIDASVGISWREANTERGPEEYVAKAWLVPRQAPTVFASAISDERTLDI